LNTGGCVLRLAGLYTLERGAHSYYLKVPEIKGRDDHIVNLLHYDDAASACIAAIRAGRDAVSKRVFLISDGHPMTREELLEATLANKKYEGKVMPKFLGLDEDLGKVYDGSISNEVLGWRPRYKSFEQFMKVDAN